jgi:hypothetical protein
MPTDVSEVRDASIIALMKDMAVHLRRFWASKQMVVLGANRTYKLTVLTRRCVANFNAGDAVAHW